jgi:hypothetical protein
VSADTLRVALPDLVATGVSNPPPVLGRGNGFAVTDALLNQALVGAAASTMRYYLSTDRVRGGADRLLAGTRPVPALGAGQSDTGTASAIIPATTPLGTYYLLACADDLAPKMAEGNESNNCATSASTVRVAP